MGKRRGNKRRAWPQTLVLLVTVSMLVLSHLSQPVVSGVVDTVDLLPESDGAAIPSRGLASVLGIETVVQDLNTAVETATSDAKISGDCSSTPCVALTFDDGPDAGSTAKILDALHQEHAVATFFLIGNRVGQNAELVKRVYREGQELGNHSWSHPDFTRLGSAAIKSQIDQTNKAIEGVGLPAPLIVRLPYGSRNNFVKQQISQPLVMWNVDPKDWHEKDPQRIDELVESGAKPGAIILMHDRPTTAAAVPKIVHNLKQKYRLVTVSELLKLTPASKGEFFGQ